MNRKRNNLSKRLLAVLCTVILLFGLIPEDGLAATGGDAELEEVFEPEVTDVEEALEEPEAVGSEIVESEPEEETKIVEIESETENPGVTEEEPKAENPGVTEEEPEAENPGVTKMEPEIEKPDVVEEESDIEVAEEVEPVADTEVLEFSDSVPKLSEPVAEKLSEDISLLSTEPGISTFSVNEISVDQTELRFNLSGSTDEKTAVLTASLDSDDADTEILWSSMDEDVVTVSAQADNRLKADVQAVGAGKAKITVKASAQDGTMKQAECTVIVKQDAKTVTIDTSSLKTEYYPLETEEIQLSAETGPQAEYCNDTISWSIEGETNAKIDRDTGKIELNGLNADTETITVVATAGTAKDSYSITLKKADVLLSVEAPQLTYGDMGQVLTANIRLNGQEWDAKAFGSSVVYHQQTKENDAAVVSEEGEITIKGAGTFTVKVSTESGYYNAPEGEFEFVVQPKELTVQLEDEEISKVSDGTTGLTKENRNDIEKLLSLNMAVAEDNVSLEIAEDEWESLKYENGGIGSTIISLSGLKQESFSLGGDQASNYTLKIDELQKKKIRAKIIANEPEQSTYDMKASSEDQMVQLKGYTAVTIPAGVKGSGSETDTYWYGKEGLQLTVEQGYSLVDGESKTLEAEFFTGGEVNFYLADGTDKNAEASTYYGPYTVEFQCDISQPDIIFELAELTEDKATYLLQLYDTESGVDPDSVAYKTDGDWTQAEVSKPETNAQYECEVFVPKGKQLFVKVSDMVGNEKDDLAIPLILESNAPAITSVLVDGTEMLDGQGTMTVKQYHTLKVTAEETEQSGVGYSGVSKLYYSLTKDNELVDGYEQVELAVNKTPNTTSDIANVKTLSSSEVTIENKITEEKKLDGEYTLKVWAVDFCGNKSEEKVFQVDFDNTPPTVTVAFSEATVVYGKEQEEISYYSKDDLEVTFTVTDNYPLDGADFKPYMLSDGEQKELSWAFNFSNDRKTYTAKAKLSEDGKYKFGISGSDAAGNVMKEYITSEKVVDKTPPVLESVSYNGFMREERTNSGSIYYFGKSSETREIVLTLVEKNFDERQANAFITWIYGSTELDSKWTDDEGDKHKVTLMLPGKDDGSEDGVYALKFAYKDLAGNPLKDGEFTKNGEFVSSPMIVDMTLPQVQAEYIGYTNEVDGVYYYGQKSEKCEIRLTVTEANFNEDEAEASIAVEKDERESKVTLTESQYQIDWESTEDNRHTAIITLPKEEEGNYRVTCAYKDMAGNGLENEMFTSASIVIDQTNPVVTAISSTGNANGPYDEAGDYYYKDDQVQVTFTIFDENLPSDWITSLQKDGNNIVDLKSSGIVESAGDKVTFILEEEGQYTDLKVTGTDLAGNPLILQSVSGDGIGCQYQLCDEAKDDRGGNESQGSVTLIHGKVLDRKSPVAVITYSSADHPNLYDENGDGTDDTAYYNKDINVEIRITDQYGDISCPVDLNKLYAGQNSGTGSAIAGTNLQYEIKSDGSHYFTVYGTDRAGNALVVQEQIPGTEKYVETRERETGYTPKYEIVRDTVAPTFSFAVAPERSVTNKELQNGRYYFNGGYTASVTVKEDHFDPARIRVKRGSINSGDYNAAADQVQNFNVDVAHKGNQQYVDYTSAGNGVYRYQIYGTDKAGNALIARDAANLDGTVSVAKVDDEEISDTSCHIVVDTVNPTGILCVDDYYRLLIESGTVELSEPYRKSQEATVSITTEDRSPVRIAYTIDSTIDGKTSNDSKGFFYRSTASGKVQGEQIFKVTDIQLEDLAGNQVILGETNHIYLDVTPPSMDELAPTISVVANANSDSRGEDGTPLFKDDVPLHIKVSDPYAGTKSSGLSAVTYHLYINGKEVEEDQRTLNPASTKKWDHNYTDPSLVHSIDETITVNASNHNYNDILVVVDAEDNAGNVNTRKYTFGIDITAPVIEVEYDNNEAENGRYFKADRIATVTVTERNFNEDLINIATETSNISSWTYSAGSSSNGDDDQWIAEITYNVDGEYTLEVSGEDLLGQEADEVTYIGTAPQDFVIDKTPPVLTLEFDRNDPVNGKYYNTSRTATLSVNDVNFNGVSDLLVNAAEGGVAPAFNFAGNTSSATFDVDGVYSFHGTVTDMAGNISLPVECEEFVIDQTAPVIVFHEVEDMTAYGKSETAFAPYISIEDINFDAAGVTVTMSRVKWDSEEEMSNFGSLLGTAFYLDELEELPENDAVYTLTAKVQDMAGNLNEESDSVTFSLNRFGSVYVLGDETTELLKKYYTNEEQYLTLTEYNLSNQADSWIDVSRNNEEEKRLVKDENYTIQLSGEAGDDCNWKKLEYRIDEENFEADGKYKVLVYSKDTLDNATTNENQASEEYVSVIEFCKDTVGPTLTLTGVEDGAIYKESTMPLLINYFDNNEMESLDVRVVYASDEGKVIDSAHYQVGDNGLEAASGKLEYMLKENRAEQKVIVTAVDRAGNLSETQEIVFTMTTNSWIRFYSNKPLFFGTIGGICGIVLLLLILLFLKQQKDKKEKEM